MALQLRTWVKKTVHGGEIHWLSGKEKVLGITVSKEGYDDSLLGHVRTNHDWLIDCLGFMACQPLQVI